MKSRTLAQKLIETGAVRVNTERTTHTDHAVGAGDVLTMTVQERLLVWKVLDPGARRGPPAEAKALYEDLSPPPLPRQASAGGVAVRDSGAGRPTKKDRRDIDRLLDDE